MADGSIKIDTKIDQSGLGKELSKLKTGLEKGIAVATKAAGVAIGALAVSFGAATAAAKKFADETGRIADMSQALGMSKKGFQELSYALKLSGTSIDSMQMGMKSLMEKAQANDKAFVRLGVSIRNADGSMRDQETILRETIAAFQRMEDGTEKAMLAQDLFSRSGQELMPLLNDEAGSLEKLTQKANELGLVMSDETIASGEALGDALDELAIAGSTLLNNVFAPFAGVVQKVAEWMTTLSGKISTAVTLHTDLGRETNTLITATTNYKKAVEDLDGAQKDITDTERTLLTGRKELARLALQTALAETSKGYASTREEIAKLEAKEAEHIRNLEKQSALMKQLDIVANGPPAAALAASKALGISIESAQKSYGVAAKNFETENAKLIKTQTELGTISVEYTETIAQLGRAINDGTLNIDIYKTTNRALYDEIMASAEAQKLLNKTIEDAPSAGTTPASGTGGPSVVEPVTALSTDVTARITTAMILALNEIDRQAKMLKLKEAGQKAAKELAINFAKGLVTNTVKATAAIKNLALNIGSALMETAQLISTGFKAFGDLVRFDFNKALADLDGFLNDVTKFFIVTIPAMPIYFKSGFEMIQSFLSGMLSRLPEITTYISNAINQITALIIQYGPQIISDGISLISSLLSGIVSSAPQLISGIVFLLNQLSASLIEHGPQMVNDAGTLIIALITGLVAAAPQLIQAALTIITSLATFILDNLPEIILLGVQLVISLITGIAQALPTLIQAIVDNLPAILDAIITAFPLIIQAIADNLPMIIEAIMRAIPMIIVALIAALPDILLAILSMASSIAQGLFDGLVAGIKGLFKGIGDVFGKYILDPIKNFFGIHSPSTVFSSLGGDMIQGMINGLLSAGAGIWNAVSGIFTGLWDNIKNIFSGAVDLGKSIVGGVSSGISGVTNAVTGTVSNIVNDPLGSLGAFGEKTISAVGGAAQAVGGAVSNVASSAVSAVSSGLKKLKFWASGTNSAPAGLAVVGERGPELLQMGGGERVYPSNITEKIMAGLSNFGGLGNMGLAGAGGITIHNVITAPVMIDGRQTARAVYENWDKVNR